MPLYTAQKKTQQLEAYWRMQRLSRFEESPRLILNIIRKSFYAEKLQINPI